MFLDILDNFLNREISSFIWNAIIIILLINYYTNMRFSIKLCFLWIRHWLIQSTDHSWFQLHLRNARRGHSREQNWHSNKVKFLLIWIFLYLPWKYIETFHWWRKNFYTEFAKPKDNSPFVLLCMFCQHMSILLSSHYPALEGIWV